VRKSYIKRKTVAPCEEVDEQMDEFLSSSDAHLYSHAVEHGKEQAEKMIDHVCASTAACEHTTTVQRWAPTTKKYCS